MQQQLQSAVTTQLTEIAALSSHIPTISEQNEGSSAAECELAASDGAGTLLQESLGANMQAESHGIESEDVLAATLESSIPREIDVENQRYGQQILSDANSSWNTTLRSRVLVEEYSYESLSL